MTFSVHASSGAESSTESHRCDDVRSHLEHVHLDPTLSLGPVRSIYFPSTWNMRPHWLDYQVYNAYRKAFIQDATEGSWPSRLYEAYRKASIKTL